MNRIGPGLPELAFRDRAAAIDGHDGSARQAIDAGEGRSPGGRGTVMQQHAADLIVRQNARDVGTTPQGVNVGREGDETFAPMKMNVALSHVVAGQHQLAGGAIPDREGEVPEQVVGALFTPPLVCTHDQRAVRVLLQSRAFDAEELRQFLPVIEGAGRRPGPGSTRGRSAAAARTDPRD
ncbi:MAG: hypothetical protein WDM85_10470 [Caulobacteraceae bacterium]